MRERAVPPDAGFVVEWQLAEESPIIDLSTAESDLILADDPAVLAETRGLNLDLGTGL